ncbi:putative allantoinase [Zea mays]|nr:putative allantoinase [Zea mays]
MDAKRSGASLSIETCPHYLTFSSEEVPDGDTRFKCSPPICGDTNRENLWKALLDGHIDMLSSDHSPSTPDLKLMEEGDFLRAWGGISSLQNISAYLGKQLSGKVLSTFVRGNLVFAEDKHANAACGVPILAK